MRFYFGIDFFMTTEKLVPIFLPNFLMITLFGYECMPGQRKLHMDYLTKIPFPICGGMIFEKLQSSTYREIETFYYVLLSCSD